MTDKDVGFGIIGCGTIAKVHAAALGDVDGARVVAVSSRRKDAADALARESGARAVNDHRKLLEDPEVDVVAITTSSGKSKKSATDAK